MLHLDELVVGHVGLGQQHVHVAGHAARDRMNGELHVHAALAKLVGQLPHLMLRLRDGHAVAGHDDNQTRVAEQQGGFVGLNRFDGFARASPRSLPLAWAHLPWERARASRSARFAHARTTRRTVAGRITSRVRSEDFPALPTTLVLLVSERAETRRTHCSERSTYRP